MFRHEPLRTRISSTHARSPLRGVLCSAAVLWSLAAPAAGQQPEPAAGSATAEPATSGSNGRFVLGEELPRASHNKADSRKHDDEYTPTDWERLIPPDWEPLKDFEALDFNSMSDGDPRAIAALRKLQNAWKDAPLNPDIQREKVEISGFIVPLDNSDAKTIEELLLVPYFGACIHAPPPPSNQIIHVTLKEPLKGFQMMDAVTVRGELHPSRLDTQYGSAGYRLEALDVQAYEDPSGDAAGNMPAAGTHP